MGTEVYLIGAVIILGLLLWPRARREHLTTTTTTTTTTGPEFDKVVKDYRDNYINFMTTGKPEYKTAYLSAQAQIEKYIKDAEAKIKSDADYMDKFIQQYAGSSTKLQGYKNQAEMVLNTGPGIGDQYRMEKKLREKMEVDLTPLYVKLGIAGLIAAVGIVALFLK